ncbi:M24 family metallopeptidase [Planctomicrobium sp. SH664]|uniref:M24 family metallopeptidase n=1 Tax=Planctomicrobium sp. SH664 TaxID=3448125 RepID=UPI003F5B4D9B
MSTTALSPNSPISSGEMQTLDFERMEEVRRRHALLTEYLQLKGYDALLLQDPANFAWLTCGGDNTPQFGIQPTAAILVTSDARVVLCNNVDSGRLFDRELAGLGFLLKERPWTEDLSILRQDVCRGRRVAGDVWFPGTENVAEDLHPFRSRRSAKEIEQLRELGRDLAHAVEATARNFEPGAMESEVAGHLAHRLIKHRIIPCRIQVMADAQGWRYRHWTFGNDAIERHCVLSAVGRRHGLYVAATRTVCLGSPSEELQQVHRLATLIQTTGMYFTQPGWTMEETWKRVLRIYEKFGVPDEWRCADQADIIGFRPCEVPVLPNSTRVFESQTAVFWHPSVRSSLVGDTILVRDNGMEVLTPTQNWPVLSVRVKNETFDRPGLLIREVPPEHASVLFS